MNINLKLQNSHLETYPSPISFSPSLYPQIKYPYTPVISAQGAVVLDRASKVPLFEKNPKLRFSPASTTKIMTALVGLEYFKLDDVLTIFEPNVAGSNLVFEQGERFSFEDLLYAMMLPSSNDASLAIAQNYPGGEKAFITKMNTRAKEFRLIDTYFDDPVGLLDEKDYTTPVDLARLSSIALDNLVLREVVSTKNKIIVNESGKSYFLSNLNRLLDLPGISGIKTGFTEGAGQVLVTSKKIDGNSEIIIVVMQSEDRFGDTQIILNYLDNNINYLSIHP